MQNKSSDRSPLKSVPANFVAAYAFMATGAIFAMAIIAAVASHNLPDSDLFSAVGGIVVSITAAVTLSLTKIPAPVKTRK
jgi:hypothetical protein